MAQPCQPAKKCSAPNTKISPSLSDYLKREFGNIKEDPRYKKQIQSGALVVFEQDKLFHIKKALDGSWLEWRILSYIPLQLANLGNKPSPCLWSYLDQEFENIKSDPYYKKNIDNGRLRVFEKDSIFHIQDALDGSFLEWRILSYNALRSHWIDA